MARSTLASLATALSPISTEALMKQLALAIALALSSFAATAAVNLNTATKDELVALPGIGRYFVTSVTSRDYPVLMGVTLLMTTVVALVNLVVDLTYAYLDPRIRYG